MAKTKLGNVKGPKGEQGVRGSKWYNTDKITGESTSGTVFPDSGIADAMVGDMALNPATLNLYMCQTAGNAATAKWVYVSCIKGPQGPKGDKGDPTTVDAALSATSTNPIQNKAVNTAITDVRDSLSQYFKNLTPRGPIDDFDTMTENGVFSCNISDSSKNAPSTYPWGFLLVFSGHGFTLQIYVPDNKADIAIRTQYNGQPFTDVWYYLVYR